MIRVTDIYMKYDHHNTGTWTPLHVLHEPQQGLLQRQLPKEVKLKTVKGKKKIRNDLQVDWILLLLGAPGRLGFPASSFI